jgi:hypothetical protein
MKGLPLAELEIIKRDPSKIEEYAGNYSYLHRILSWGESATLTFYYKNENGELAALGCEGTDRKSSLAGTARLRGE